MAIMSTDAGGAPAGGGREATRGTRRRDHLGGDEMGDGKAVTMTRGFALQAGPEAGADQASQGRGGVRAVAATFSRNVRETSWRDLLDARMWGLALLRAWVYLLFFGAATSCVTWDGQPMPAAVFDVSTLCLFASMYGAALISDRFEAAVRKGWVRWAAPALTAAGTLCCASTTQLVGAPLLLACVAGGAATGVGSGVMSLGYSEAYRNVPSRQTCFESPLAFLVAAVGYFALSKLPSPAIVCVVTSLIPLASGAILYVPLGIWDPSHAPAARPVPVPVLRFALRVGSCAVLVGLADGVVRAVFISVSGTSAGEFFGMPLIWASLITLAVIWGCVLFADDFNLLGMYRVTLVIMAFFFQLLPIFVGSYFENILALAGYGTFNALIWIILADIASTYRLSSVVVFGTGWSMLSVGVWLGSLFGQWLVAAFAPFQPQAISAVALAATVAVALSYALVLKDSDLIELTRIGESMEDARADGSARAKGRPGTVKSESGLPGAGRPGESGEARVPRFANRCREVAKEHGLSERETEIMILYSKGRSYARLQEELSISRGTVTTHLRHIYQKLGVHSKQEMLDLIEGRLPDGEGR